MTKEKILAELYKIASIIDSEGKTAITPEMSFKFRNLLFTLDSEYKQLYNEFAGRKFSLLVFGDRNSVFIRMFIRNLKLFFDSDLTVNVAGFDTDARYTRKNFHNLEDNFYKFRSYSRGNPVIRRIKNYKAIKEQVEEVIKATDSDILHIHYLHSYWGSAWKSFRKGNTIITIWGSDLYKESKRSRIAKSYQRKLLDVSKIITVGNAFIGKDFISEFGDKYSSKLRYAMFGTPVDLLEHDFITADEIESFREKYQIPRNKIAVIVGSSADKSEHHIEIINSLKPLKNKVFLIIPMTYGDLSLVETVEQALVENKMDGTVIKHFLSNREMAALKCLGDITIFIPDADAFSAFLLESLYAGSVVITGEWLPYNWIDENKVYCHRIKAPMVENIREKVGKVIDSLKQEKEKAKLNKEKILRIASWQYRFKDWLRVYCEVLS